MKNIIVTDCGNSPRLAKKIARKLKAGYSPLAISSFPDGDIYLKFNVDLKNKKLIIIQSFQPNPGASLFNVLFAAETAKDLGAKKVILAAPYLAYLRQDKRFNPGECISSKVMASLLSNSIDELITVDPHVHRYKSLKDIFAIPARKLTASLLIAGYIKKHFKNEIIIGPDQESYQWAEEIAKHLHIHAAVLKKTRFTARKVKVKMIQPIAIKNKNVVIVDDIISTGHTIAEAAKQAKKLGAKTISAICVHGLFVEKALDRLKRVGVSKVISTNTVKHKTNKIDVSGLIVKELKKQWLQ